MTARRLEHDLYKALFDSTVVGVSVVDAERHMIDCNEAFCRILGRPKHEVVGQLATAFNYDEEDDVSTTGMARLVSGELDGYTVEKRYRRADGTPVWVRLTTSAISRTHDLYVGIIEDLTERDRAEMRLRERTALLTRAQQIGGVGSWVFYPHEQRDEWSPEARRIFGFSDEEADRCDPALFFGAVHPDDYDWLTKAANESFEAGLPTEFEYRIIRRSDGEVRWVREQVDVERGPDGAPYRMLGIVMDVTDRRRAEAELRAKTALLERAQQVAKLGSYDVDLRIRRVTVSPELARVLGLPEQTLETSLDEFRRRFVAEDDQAALAAGAEAAYRVGGPVHAPGRPDAARRRAGDRHVRARRGRGRHRRHPGPGRGRAAGRDRPAAGRGRPPREDDAARARPAGGEDRQLGGRPEAGDAPLVAVAREHARRGGRRRTRASAAAPSSGRATSTRTTSSAGRR